MGSRTVDVKLTPLQVSHAIVAVTEYAKTLITNTDEEPEGGEHEDYLVAQSIVRALVEAKEAAASR